MDPPRLLEAGRDGCLVDKAPPSGGRQEQDSGAFATFGPPGLSNPVPMERTCPGVATLRRDPDKATGGRADDAEAADAALAASGDGSAFERLYRSHSARVHSLVRRMMGLERADDVTQDVFIRAWQKLSTFRGEAAFGTWLHRLAVNVILARRTSLGVE